VVSDSTPVLRLKPLADAPMKTLSGHLLPSVAKVASGASAGDVANWCAQTAAGNPFYLQVLCAHYEDTRQPFTVPPDMRSATTRRIELLPKDCRRVLELTALLGRHASLESLQTLSGIPGLAFVDAVQSLEEEGYLRMQAGSARLAHDLLTECTLELLQPLTLAVLHGRVAANLETRYEQSHDAALLWECAQHWALSGEVGKALRFVLGCAQHAIVIGQAGRALLFLEGAVGFAVTEADQVQLLSETVFAARAANNWETALRTCRKLGALPQGASIVGEHTDIELISLDADWRVNLKATAFVDRLLKCTTAPTATADHRADAAFTLFRIAFERGDRALASKAYESVEPFLGGDIATYARRILPLAFLSSYGDKEHALRLARELRAQLHTFDETERFGAAHNIGVSLCYLGAADESLALYEEFFQRAQALELPEWTVDFCLNACWVHICAEEFAQARHWYARAKELVDEGRATGNRARYLAQGTYLAFDADRIQEARDLLEGFANCCGESLRNGAFLSFSRLKLDLLNPNYSCSDEAIAKLDAQFEATKALAGVDTLVLTWFEALSRRGFHRRAAAVLRDYLDASRLERSALPPSLLRLTQLIGHPPFSGAGTEGT
jgi:hypothetical protein